MGVRVRTAEKKDLEAMLRLIRELAEYEKALDEVENSVDRMEVDGFGERPVFEALVAEEKGEVIGMSIFYFRYSTWKGKRIYLEDLIVTASARGKGVGKLLLDATIARAKDYNCTGLMWQVLDWNEPAIAFYKKYDVRFESEWLNCHIDF